MLLSFSSQWPYWLLIELIDLNYAVNHTCIGLHTLEKGLRGPEMRHSMGPGGQKLKAKVEALQLSTEGLFKLLGSSDPDKRLDFWQRLKGITSVADLLLIDHELTVANNLITQVQASVNTLNQAAKEIGQSGAASAAR
jgi:hypothetical protein